MKQAWLANLNPSYFTLTMATGIVAIALQIHGYQYLSAPLTALALVSWITLLALYTWRLIKYPLAVFDNLRTPGTAFSFFSFVAASNVCGLLLHNMGFFKLALATWFVSFVYWSTVLYLSFASLCIGRPGQLSNIVDGGWLMMIVATQSLVLLGARVAHTLGAYQNAMMVEITMLWCLGVLFYGIFVTLFCYRIFFTKTDVEDFTPLIWVVMGAAAISANAASSLVLAKPGLATLAELRPVVQMSAILWWTWASWWIPMLFGIGLWKHGYHQTPLVYTPALWSMVFPLGMYCVATKKLVLSAQFTPLLTLSSSVLWIACIAWIFVVTAYLKSTYNNL
ncbi:MAG: tellurite resistance/C4-dicarboxylate transporter family protein [Granulosicoccaceae bacterium]